MDKKKHWLSFVDLSRRKNLLLILQELSSLLNRKEPNFIIIGAMSLLIKGSISGFRVLWDVDLLFRNRNGIVDFRRKKKSKDLRIVELEDEITKNKNIGSLHTLWSFDNTWFNVDYILKNRLFNFYNPLKRGIGPYTEKVRFKNKDYHIALFLADPIDIFVEKTVFLRMERELKLKDEFGIDIKHCLYMLQKYGKEDWFWRRVQEDAIKIDGAKKLKKNLITLIEIKDELGYTDIILPKDIMERIKQL